MDCKPIRVSHSCYWSWVQYGLVVFALLGQTSIIEGAEFLSITPGEVAALSNFWLSNPNVEVTAISGDGRTIAGQIVETGVIYDCAMFSCGAIPFVWSVDDPAARRMDLTSTPLNFGTYSGNGYSVRVNALSFDGKSDLLVSDYRHFETALENQGTVQLLRPVIDPAKWLWGAGISNDAGVIVGNVGAQPFRWDQAFGMQAINGLPSGYPFSADAISSDGQVIVLNAQPGIADLASTNALRGNAYTLASSGLSELKQLTGDSYSHAVASSFDGSTIVGNSLLAISSYETTSHAVKWHGTVPSELGSLTGYGFSTARDVSSDGRFVVGLVYNQDLVYPFSKIFGPNVILGLPMLNLLETSSRAVIWDENGNVSDLKSFLSSRYGLAHNSMAGY